MISDAANKGDGHTICDEASPCDSPHACKRGRTRRSPCAAPCAYAASQRRHTTAPPKPLSQPDPQKIIREWKASSGRDYLVRCRTPARPCTATHTALS